MKKILFTIISLTIFFACSSDESVEKSILEQINDDGSMYYIDDFVNSGFKPSKN